jgi:hypothetical protein
LDSIALQRKEHNQLFVLDNVVDSKIRSQANRELLTCSGDRAS